MQPAAIEDGWDTDPWVLTEVNGKLYGRGSTDDKGPVLGWIHALQCYQECGIEQPVNFKLEAFDLEDHLHYLLALSGSALRAWRRVEVKGWTRC